MTRQTIASDITLQINLCAGDLAYARQTVAALVETHRPCVREVLVVGDACRPHSTPWLHADTRFPSTEFSGRVTRLRELCAELQAAKLVDRVVWLEPDPTKLAALNARFAGIATPLSHDHLGHAFSAYFLGWDAPQTRYVAHFDADILLWQAPGHSWLRSAVDALADDATLLAASPRIAPPDVDQQTMVRIEAAGSGWSPHWPLDRMARGWTSPWFSTRCHLIDRERLAAVLPLRGRASSRRNAAINRALAPLFSRGIVGPSARSALGRRLAHRVPPFPLPPEVLLHEHAQARGFRCLYLNDPHAWFIHPDTKPAAFLDLLPCLLESVVRNGETPLQQRGVSGLDYAAWSAFARCRR